jgi:hypothetical protein
VSLGRGGAGLELYARVRLLYFENKERSGKAAQNRGERRKNVSGPVAFRAEPVEVMGRIMGVLAQASGSETSNTYNGNLRDN